MTYIYGILSCWLFSMFCIHAHHSQIHDVSSLIMKAFSLFPGQVKLTVFIIWVPVRHFGVPILKMPFTILNCGPPAHLPTQDP